MDGIRRLQALFRDSRTNPLTTIRVPAEVAPEGANATRAVACPPVRVHRGSRIALTNTARNNAPAPSNSENMISPSSAPKGGIEGDGDAAAKAR
jgi:hypothetical protein